MHPKLPEAFITGYERLVPWADLLDRINVFPVADGDTGRNLMVSLSPLRELTPENSEKITKVLYHSARGNSGNIAAQFLAPFLGIDTLDSASLAAKDGLEKAYLAVLDPQPGTVLTVLDALIEQLMRNGEWYRSEQAIEDIVDHTADAVKSTRELLPALKTAGVVDAGALGMFIFLEGFFRRLTDQTNKFLDIYDIFEGLLQISPSFQQKPEEGYCLDFVIKSDQNTAAQISQLVKNDESPVVYHFHDHLKIHLHTNDRDRIKENAQTLGQVVTWMEDDLGEQTKTFNPEMIQTPIHIVTDGAGSLTRELAASLGITLLDSYILIGGTSQPETGVNPSDLYTAMRSGIKVATSQASLFERHQHYHHLLHLYSKVLYLCVGSAFTGNYQIANSWKHQNDTQDCFTVLDTQAASGKLAIIAVATARFARQADDPDEVIRFARRAVLQSDEYICVDRLQFLAAGGRLSKTSAFFGDMLHMKPIITPGADGAKKVGVARNQEGQLQFVIEKLSQKFDKHSNCLILLEYSDNRKWVCDAVMPVLRDQFQGSEILLLPFSLTSGAHIGPGAWALACLPEISQSL